MAQFMPLVTNIVIATITAYCACKTCCGPNAKGITANGQRPIQGITIAASRTIPFGSTVASSAIPKSLSARQTLVVQDRLARRYDSRFDIYMSSHESARKFGIKTNQTVTIIQTK